MAAVGEVEQLCGRWRALWSALQAHPIPEQIFDDLVEAYEEPQRAYHRLDHVIDCLRIFDSARSEADRPSEVEAAIWFHDAIYDPARGDNERRSADWAPQVLRNAGVDTVTSRRIQGLIVSTGHDIPVDSQDARLLVDIDLSILGRDPSAFLAYEEQDKREYAWVPIMSSMPGQQSCSNASWGESRSISPRHSGAVSSRRLESTSLPQCSAIEQPAPGALRQAKLGSAGRLPGGSASLLPAPGSG